MRQKENEQIEQSLIILKILNFISKNTALFDRQGISFITGKEPEVGYVSEFNFGIEKLHGLGAFLHHAKLDANMLKSIQDPYKLISGGISGLLKQIFGQCSFLFNFETKLLYFKLFTLMGLDVTRGINYLREF